MSSTLQCYVGTGTTQVNTTCNLKKNHYKSMKGVDYVMETDDTVSLKNSISHCLMFNPHNGKKMDTDDTFLCDEQKICSGLKENIWLTKVHSVLYCRYSLHLLFSIYEHVLMYYLVCCTF